MGWFRRQRAAKRTLFPASRAQTRFCAGFDWVRFAPLAASRNEVHTHWTPAPPRSAKPQAESKSTTRLRARSWSSTPPTCPSHTLPSRNRRAHHGRIAPARGKPQVRATENQPPIGQDARHEDYTPAAPKSGQIPPPPLSRPIVYAQRVRVETDSASPQAMPDAPSVRSVRRLPPPRSRRPKRSKKRRLVGGGGIELRMSRLPVGFAFPRNNSP
jgi:hypothetical protein